MLLTAGKIKRIGLVFVMGFWITIEQKISWWTSNWYSSSLQNTYAKSHTNKVWLIRQLCNMADFKKVRN